MIGKVIETVKANDSRPWHSGIMVLKTQLVVVYCPYPKPGGKKGKGSYRYREGSLRAPVQLRLRAHQLNWTPRGDMFRIIIAATTTAGTPAAVTTAAGTPAA